MKMIASARLRKAETALHHARPYAEALQRVLQRVAAGRNDRAHPLAEEREPKKVAIIVFGSEDGLCGSFNAMLYKKFIEARNAHPNAGQIQVYPVGRKIQAEIKKTTAVEIIPVPLSHKDRAAEILNLADQLLRGFMDGEIDRVEIVYARFKSIGTQIMTRLPLLPWKEHLPANQNNRDYIQEPDPETITNTLYPLLLRATLLRALLENQLSEQAARVLSMQIASDNASKLLKNLQLEYNKLRQQNITAELLDIVGGTTA
jgi:F-type H+-transporting ATPase subunit gamma